MPGIPIKIALHRLNIKSGIQACKAKKRRIFFKEKKEAIEKEVDRLLEADFIKPVQFLKWIANTVLVKKSNGKWQMCKSSRYEAKPYKILLRFKWRKIFGAPLNSERYRS